VRGLSAVVVVGFLGVLGAMLPEPGYSWTRLALFAVLGGLAVVGGVGIYTQRELVATAGACGLLLLGFWQAVLWIYITPVAGVLVVGALVTANTERTETVVA